MKETLLITLLTVLSLGFLRPTTTLAESKLSSGTERSQIGQKIEGYVKEHEKTTAGMETAVFDKEGTIYRGNFGYMDKEKGIKADDGSVFEWGSVTKLTIWVSVMQLWEQGKLDLEEDIRTYLPKDFLRNLRYDSPITMIDLMNHQAGFDETPLYMQGCKSLKDLLSMYQPAQSFEPGTTTAYSNYGTGLAAYIVERLSGQDYVDYVHEHIFDPLGMNRTAILPDLSDNPYVQNKRKEDRGYDAKGKLLGDVPFEVGLYPVGRATGTLEDLQRFAQALLRQDKLFQEPETWTTLYSATSTYPGTDQVRNAHGFWSIKRENGSSQLWHGGQTTGFSANLMLDLDQGLGQVVMTNQAQETDYNFDMLQLVFGKQQTASKGDRKAFSPGYYRTMRTINQGPATFYQLLGSIQHLSNPSEQLTEPSFWTLDHRGSREGLANAVTDLEKVSDGEVWTKYGLVILAGLAIIYALVSLLFSLLRGLYRLIRGSQKPHPDKTWMIWQLLTRAGILTVAGNFLLLAFSFTATDMSVIQSWRYILFAGLGLVLAACTVYPLFSKDRGRLSRSRLILTALNSLSALAIVANILYWNLYQWWTL